ncbi:hypothetical protein [Diaphorobacter aerolatus]|uniref:hypothetical protein n=1 Tax=Diaphorobacter aerolatus TaxID=1288495 RepID=UPI00299F7041|nr:hypothetical protein [Diaphorobacter aerolatus]
MHQLLELAGVVGSPLTQLRATGWSDARVSRLAREFELTPEQAGNAARIAQTILEGEGAWAWDASVIDRSINEASLVYQGQNLRLDRLVRKRAADGRSAQWWVLDYKSAVTPQSQPQLIEQLRQYLRAVEQQLGHEGAVHAAFLTGDGRLVELDDSGTPTAGSAAGSTGMAGRADNGASLKDESASGQGSLF